MSDPLCSIPAADASAALRFAREVLLNAREALHCVFHDVARDIGDPSRQALLRTVFRQARLAAAACDEALAAPAPPPAAG